MNERYPTQRLSMAILAVKLAAKPHECLTCYFPYSVAVQSSNDNLTNTKTNKVLSQLVQKKWSALQGLRIGIITNFHLTS